MGALRIVAGVIGIVDTGLAERFCSRRAVEGNAGVTVGFERRPTSGTSDRLGINGLVAARASGHDKRFQKHSFILENRQENLRTWYFSAPTIW
jgi:hypothetical protein